MKSYPKIIKIRSKLNEEPSVNLIEITFKDAQGNEFKANYTQRQYRIEILKREINKKGDMYDILEELCDLVSDESSDNAYHQAEYEQSMRGD